MEQEQGYSPEVITSYVWDAIKDLPGLAALHRTTLQSLGEKVHMERRGPVQLDDDDGSQVLDLHIVVTREATIPVLAETLQREVTAYLERMTGIRLAAINIHVDDIVWDEPAVQ